MSPNSINSSPAWQALRNSCKKFDATPVLEWFAQDADRVQKLTLRAAGLIADFSKQRINDEVLAQLEVLADTAGLRTAIDGMFNGATLNTSEQRAVLHVALRDSVSADLNVDGVVVKQVVEEELNRMLKAADTISTGRWHGFTGKAIRTVVHIGIGGSDLGPRMVTRALTPLHGSQVSVHFVANLDAHELTHTLKDLEAGTTLFLIASKTFGTEETLCNAKIARQWIVDELGSDTAVANHMIALSSNSKRVADFGIQDNNRFEFWDWVGGRYSVWSVIGMPIAIAIGSKGFREFLNGASDMDEHFRQSPWAANMPVLMALIGLWNRNFLKLSTQAVVPYYHFLDLLPQYLQQADMESNGKRVTQDGRPLETESAPVVWGTAGTDAQHAYFQLLHQGTQVVPVDFVVAINHYHDKADSHQRLLVHAIAQSEALLRGRSEENNDDGLAAHKNCPGNRPSTTLLMNRVDPYHLGAVLALYEHKIFVQGRILGINSFDQFGVELGKQLASELRPMMIGDEPLRDRDASTLNLLAICRGENSSK